MSYDVRVGLVEHN